MNEPQQIREACPYPKDEDQATAVNIERWLTASAFFANQQLMDSLGDLTKATSLIQNMSNQFAAATFLRAIRVTDPIQADELARKVWIIWESGEVGEWLWDDMKVALATSKIEGLLVLEEQKYDAIEPKVLNQHFKGSELYEQMYRVLSLNSHKVSYQLEDLGMNAALVRKWLDEYEAENPADDDES